MEVRLLYFADCPHWRLAEARLRAALAGLEDTGSAVTHELVETPEQAERTGFRGSPTILVDGLDPFATPDDPVGLSCRIYRGPDGVEHSPTVAQLLAVLSSGN
ncbi:MAG: thioredoxin family protein [Candidatus Dormiibacterota bacterium]